MNKLACLLLGALLLVGCSKPGAAPQVPGNLIDTADPIVKEPVGEPVVVKPRPETPRNGTWFDLNGDGEDELILGPVGVWTSEPIDVQWGDGRSMHPFVTPTDGFQHRVDMGSRCTWTVRSCCTSGCATATTMCPSKS